MTNGPFEVSKRTEKSSGALAVSFEGSSSFAGSTFVAALFTGAPPLLFVAAPAVTAIAIKRIKAAPATTRFDTRIVFILLSEDVADILRSRPGSDRLSPDVTHVT